ncbi:hypothetical protein ACET3Z_030171 [Daucus carota]
MGRKKQKVVLPPDLPPDVAEDDVEVSDEDLAFVKENIEHVGFLSTLDTQSITRHVTRVADVKEDALESLYEQRLRKKTLLKEKDENLLEVDPVDALPVKTPDGKIVFRTVPKVPKVAVGTATEGEATSDNEDNVADKSLVRLSKAEKRAKFKKLRKEAKKQGKEVNEIEEVNETSQADVLEEVKKDLTAEEASESKKYRLAEIGTALLTDPEANIKSLSEMLQISKSEDRAIVTLGLKSLLAVFKDIIPGYRIRLPTEKEQAMVVSKAVKKMRFYESTLLSVYKAYLLKLFYLEGKPAFQRVAIRCICSLLEAVPHFNFRERLLAVVVKNISSADDVVRKLCCATIKSLFMNEGKHGGEVTVEAVRSIAALVKAHDCQLHPDSIEVFMSLLFDEDLGRAQRAPVDKRSKSKKFKKRKNQEEQPNQLLNNDKKKARKEMISQTQEEVDAEYKAASFAQDIAERRRMQTETLSAVFEIYFRILKHTFQTRTDATSGSYVSSGGHPLLVSCLNGIGKFSHLVDLDFMADLMSYLRKLARGSGDGNGSPEDCSGCLTVSERLQCCIVAFKVMKSNLDALNIDLQDFFAQLYQLILEYRPGRDKGEVLAEALKIMLCDDRQHDMQRAAAFIKRLATFSLCFGAAESMAALVTLKHLLQKNVKCRNLLENDAGGGSVSGPVANYHPYSSDPNLSGALASVLWELNLLSKHYHPSVATIALNIANLTNTTNQVYHANVSPQQAFAELSLEKESFNANIDINKSGNKRKRVNVQQAVPTVDDAEITSRTDEVEVRKKLSEHFFLLRDISENGRLKSELDRTTKSLQLYQQYKKQKKKQR